MLDQLTRGDLIRLEGRLYGEDRNSELEILKHKPIEPHRFTWEGEYYGLTFLYYSFLKSI